MYEAFETYFTGLNSGLLILEKLNWALIAEIGAELDNKFAQLTAIVHCLD